MARDLVSDDLDGQRWGLPGVTEVREAVVVVIDHRSADLDHQYAAKDTSARVLVILCWGVAQDALRRVVAHGETALQQVASGGRVPIDHFADGVELREKRQGE